MPNDFSFTHNTNYTTQHFSIEVFSESGDDKYKCFDQINVAWSTIMKRINSFDKKKEILVVVAHYCDIMNTISMSFYVCDESMRHVSTNKTKLKYGNVPK